MNQQSRPDVLVTGGGTTYLFDPVSERAKEWVEENVAYEPWQTFGGALAVEHRYIAGLVDGARRDGLVVEV